MSVNRNFSVKFFHIAMTGLAMTALLACSQGESNVASGNREGVLHFGNHSEPQSIDPHVMSGTPGVNIANALYEGLVVRNPATLEMEAGVAERWDISDDGKVMTFYLNPAARWSSGDPITAGDFVWSLRRSLHPDMGNQLAYILFSIVGAEAFSKGELTDADKLGIQALDTHTLQITLNNPNPFFLGILGTYPTYPVHRATVEAHGKFTDRFTPWTRVENFVGNGPFTLAEWKINRRLMVSKSETYWDADNVALNAIVFHPIDKEVSEEKMFRAGQLHYTSGVPINDLRVRQALAMATDREKLVETVLLGTELANAALVPAGTPDYTSPDIVRYEPQQARVQLAEAGYPGGQGWPGLEYLYNTSENHRKIAIALQQMWKDELNIDISLINQDWKVYLDTTTQRNYTMSRRGWIAADLNPAAFLAGFTSGNGNNDTGFSNSRFDQIILNLAPETADRAERLALMQEAEALLLQSAAVIPLYTYNSKHLVQPSVKGAPGNVLDIVRFKYISLDPKVPAWNSRD